MEKAINHSAVRKVKGAMVYPGVIITVAIGAIAVIGGGAAAYFLIPPLSP